MALDPETLRNDLVEALRHCEASTTPEIRQERLQAVRQILQNWKLVLEGPNAEDEENALPETLFYISGVKLRGFLTLLHGLAPIANTLGVTLYRANLRIHLSGEGREPSDWVVRRHQIRYLGEAGNGNPLEDVDEDEEYDFENIMIREFEIRRLTTVAGSSLDEFVGVHINENVIIPENAAEGLGEPDEEEHDTPEGIYGSIHLEHWYNRYIMVFAPRGIVNVGQA
ncbi:hypothetical protein SCHPADRAFT_887971 [Schizopora paradoxa]|uniref:Uncharacterized protein n=1 Tax=Schizopora paradoxa TaxID=27342 RepID=A0A0H2RVY6_9AGAM|nr:hypothetical protein SCHPADRAFT_887971 [Schizopora paradoxa]